MPIIETIVITSLVDDRYTMGGMVTQRGYAKLEWEGEINHVSWIFLDGKLQFDPPLSFDTTSKQVELFFDPSKNHSLWIIEEEDGVVVDNPDYLQEHSPILYWWPSLDATQYRVYDTAPEESEVLVQEINAIQSDAQYYAWRNRTPYDVEEGKWHLFRIEAVNSVHNTESVSDKFRMYLHGFPKKPTNASVAGSGGVFDFTITK